MRVAFGEYQLDTDRSPHWPLLPFLSSLEPIYNELVD
jgi:hypothetical protein